MLAPKVQPAPSRPAWRAPLPHRAGAPLAFSANLQAAPGAGGPRSTSMMYVSSGWERRSTGGLAFCWTAAGAAAKQWGLGQLTAGMAAAWAGRVVRAASKGEAGLPLLLLLLRCAEPQQGRGLACQRA